MRLRTAVPIIGLASVVTAACGGGKAQQPAASVTPTSMVVSEGAVERRAIAPLTGLPDGSETAGSRPSVAVKIDNAPQARPQAGLDVADVVYEEVVEGGVTRFIAVFHSQAPDLAGPVRSVRPMDPAVLAAHRGLVAYSGGIPAFVSMMRKAPVQDVNVDVATDAYSWDRSRPAPHNTFVSPARLLPKAKGDYRSPPRAMFDYRGAGDAFGDADARHVAIPYSPRQTSVYDWDAASGTWKRTSNGTAHVSASNTRIAPENLVIQFVRTHTLNYVDQSGSKVVEAVVTGRGDAWVLSGGRITRGTWSKRSDSAATKFTDAGGSPVNLAPGRTWVHFVPVGTPVTAQ